ncbi:DNA-directed RNA polymerase I subunit RPA12 [Thelohanellus kitauei]|uniref:DNA-directed RNA polymerase subunit n=1 Tax=Thelohanellus kitauei TaxID=669202 RepID=A0A0C2JZV8_THEKT|nr:DNA-directed RNA polymerase I subunit RPA12 [Thelohanellus kitauei]
MDTGLFDIDPDFCCYCGTFLRMNIRKGLLTCDSCDSSFNVLSDKFCDQHQTIIFDEDETAVVAKKKSGVDVIADRVCQKCGNPQMSFKTLQTRSADEGQTVYYTCLKCEYTDVEFA